MAGESLAKQNSLAQRFCSFLFDIFLGPNYNQAPPSVKYMTVSDCLGSSIYVAEIPW